MSCVTSAASTRWLTWEHVTDAGGRRSIIHPIAMEQGLKFAIREGGRTVGSGKVATIVE